ncbi:mercaptopyruvate sulfurtransferase [Seminavis robusta]|uniref:Mercaptopyruvate sulfurtransferase n=1 Tax=Seminavis robusta TaxID=568900 RepID=A0A9N8HLS4_9STRA|nr:mercaptopyruvate sulfurtransferase [Seminavis robusta]|eukprot:Sro940_g222540.1 mercaptopyruvate sulfurtransferase (322) ;mRNA; r:8426-9487
MSTESPNKKSKTVHSLLSGKKIVSVEESLQVFGEPGVVFVDGSWFLKDRNGREEFEAGPRIPGARYFDIDDVASKGDLNPKGLPHMMPPKDLFAASMDALDITNSDHLILYATKGCMFIHRALYQIQAMGHERDRVHLMNGSLEEWEKQGGKLDKEPAKVINADGLDLSKPTKYTATDPQNVVDIEEVKGIVNKGKDTDSIIVDVRSSERFLGSVEEPRPGLRLGHMPGAKNLFFFSLLDPDNVAQLKPKQELQKLVADAGIDIETDKRIVISCGSGATACALAAALDVCGRDPSKTAIYDGSWSEWGSEEDTPITKDPDT